MHSHTVYLLCFSIYLELDNKEKPDSSVSPVVNLSFPLRPDPLPVSRLPTEPHSFTSLPPIYVCLLIISAVCVLLSRTQSTAGSTASVCVYLWISSVIKHHTLIMQIYGLLISFWDSLWFRCTFLCPLSLLGLVNAIAMQHILLGEKSLNVPTI